MKEYKKPNFFFEDYSCPHCGKISNQIKTSRVFENKINICNEIEAILKNSLFYNEYVDDSYVNKSIIFSSSSFCFNCKNFHIWKLEIPLDELNIDLINNYKYFTDEICEIVYPKITFNKYESIKYMSNENQKLFYEAMKIFDISPKSSGTLLRTIIENILKNKYPKHLKTNLGSILNDKNVQEDLGTEIIQLCTYCKLIGNEAAHSSLIEYTEDDINNIRSMFDVIELLIDKICIREENNKELIEKVKKTNKEKEIKK